MKTVKFLHFDLTLTLSKEDQERFNNFNWENFKTGDKVYLDDNEIGYFEAIKNSDCVFIAIQ